eukprot:424934-Alexandrium_andersonii.AAC.1
MVNEGDTALAESNGRDNEWQSPHRTRECQHQPKPMHQLMKDSRSKQLCRQTQMPGKTQAPMVAARMQ